MSCGCTPVRPLSGIIIYAGYRPQTDFHPLVATAFQLPLHSQTSLTIYFRSSASPAVGLQAGVGQQCGGQRSWPRKLASTSACPLSLEPDPTPTPTHNHKRRSSSRRSKGWFLRQAAVQGGDGITDTCNAAEGTIKIYRISPCTTAPSEEQGRHQLDASPFASLQRSLQQHRERRGWAPDQCAQLMAVIVQPPLGRTHVRIGQQLCQPLGQTCTQ